MVLPQFVSLAAEFNNNKFMLPIGCERHIYSVSMTHTAAIVQIDVLMAAVIAFRILEEEEENEIHDI